MSITRGKVYKGMFSQTLVTVLMGAIEIGVFALMSRLLTQEDFGYFAIIMAVVSVFQCLTEAGLGSAVIQQNQATKEYISTALGLSIILGVCFTILLIVLANPLSELMGYGDKLSLSFRLMSVTLILCSVNSVARAMFMRSLDFMRFGWCQIIAYIISSAIGVYMAFAGYGVNSIITSSIANAIFMTVILFAVSGMSHSLRIHPRYVKEIMSYGGWLTGSVIVRRITTELDKLILTRWFPVSSIGAYNRPSGFISRITDQVNGIYDTVLFPILSTIKDDANKLQSSFIKVVSLVSWFSTIIMFGFTLGAPIIIDIFFGADWVWLIDIFKILSLSILFLAHSRIGDCYFRSLGLVKPYFNVRLVTCIITIICVYAGCYYDIMGVAIGVLVSRIIDSSIKLIYLMIKIPVSFLSLLKSIISSTWVTILIFMTCYILAPHIVYGKYACMFIYIVGGLLALMLFPKLFGQAYYDNVYLLAKTKINTFKNG